MYYAIEHTVVLIIQLPCLAPLLMLDNSELRNSDFKIIKI